jgi:hypothetical protein
MRFTLITVIKQIQPSAQTKAVAGSVRNQLNNAKWRVLNDRGGGSEVVVAAVAVASVDYQPTN